MAEYDQITRDLAQKAGDDAYAAIMRTMALHHDLNSKIMIATFAAGHAMAIPAAAIAKKLGADPDVVAEALWSRIKPIIMAAVQDMEARRG